MPCGEEYKYDFAIQQGDDVTQTFRLLADDLPVDLTGSVLLFECTEVALEHTMLVPFPLTGEMTAEFARANTTSMLSRRVRYEVVQWHGGLSGTKETIFYGSINLIPEVRL